MLGAVNPRMNSSIYGIPMGTAAALQNLNQATSAVAQFGNTNESKTPQGQTQLKIMEQLAAFYQTVLKTVNGVETGLLDTVMGIFEQNVQIIGRHAKSQ